MKDRYGREISYLRISVTDRCNMRCVYCMPESGVPSKRHEDMLSYEELARIARCSVNLGINKVRITGGEPLVRKDLPDFIRTLRAIPGIQEISVTTNGLLLSQYASALKVAGVDRVNVSLDSLKPERFREITRLGDLEIVLCGIDEALRVGLSPVKINTVMMKGINDDEILDFIDLAVKKPLHVRFIELMPLGYAGKAFQRAFMSSDEIIAVIRQKSEFEITELERDDVRGAGPAIYYRIGGSRGSIGFISALSHQFCHECNRLRLTADGKMEPCLASSFEVDLGHAIRLGCQDAEIEELVKRAVLAKPISHEMCTRPQYYNRVMCKIGG